MSTQHSALDSTPIRHRECPARSGEVPSANAFTDTALPPEFADDALALQFSARYGNDLRYTAAWARWNTWDGAQWKPDDTCYVFDLVRRLCRRVGSRCSDKNLARRVASAATVAAVERLARTDRRQAASVDQWDAEPWSLNTPAGIVDLRTGSLRPATREDYCTKITVASPSGTCHLWSDFLARITNGSVELQQFLQRMSDYALTGVTREHALFFLYGTGANGKSVFINTLSGVMGDYAKTASIETFTASAGEHHHTDLAGLRGARIVTAVETEDGRRWAESKLKALTGGDRIAARFMRQDFFEFTPQFKLLVAGNHKPSIRTVDEAIRRRFNLVPFAVTIPPAERDPELSDKLRHEWGGILQWVVDGCLNWQRDGLNPPAIVRDATADYMAAEDALGRWLENCCAPTESQFTAGVELFESWHRWCEQNGEQSGSQKRFSQNLEARGFSRQRSADARGFSGLALK